MENTSPISTPGNWKPFSRVIPEISRKKRILSLQMKKKERPIFRNFQTKISPFSSMTMIFPGNHGMIHLCRWSKSVLVFALICGFTCFYHSYLYPQHVIGLSTQYDDRYDKWVILTSTEGLEGTIEATWALMGDYSEWQYNLGDQSGIIRLRQK